MITENYYKFKSTNIANNIFYNRTYNYNMETLETIISDPIKKATYSKKASFAITTFAAYLYHLAINFENRNKIKLTDAVLDEMLMANDNNILDAYYATLFYSLIKTNKLLSCGEIYFYQGYLKFVIHNKTINNARDICISTQRFCVYDSNIYDFNIFHKRNLLPDDFIGATIGEVPLFTDYCGWKEDEYVVCKYIDEFLNLKDYISISYDNETKMNLFIEKHKNMICEISKNL